MSGAARWGRRAWAAWFGQLAVLYAVSSAGWWLNAAFTGSGHPREFAGFSVCWAAVGLLATVAAAVRHRR